MSVTSYLCSTTASARKSAPVIKVRFAAETYALSGRTTQLECYAYGK